MTKANLSAARAKISAAGAKPTVSVVMATYNGAEYIREQLDSIIAQTYPLHELIIQDDCSTDATPAICREYEARFPFVHFYENKRNTGFNLNFKTAVMRATGDFIALSDQDDVWATDKIARQVETLQSPGKEMCAICFSSHLRGADMAHTRTVRPQHSPEALLFAGFAGHTMLLRRGFAQDESHWLPHFFYDWGLAICAQLEGGIAFIDKPLNWHRTNDKSACAELDRQYAAAAHHTPHAWEPYLHGWRNYRRLQQAPAWAPLYTFIHERSDGNTRLSLMHRMAGYMLSRSPWALLRLCLECLRHRRTIYPTPQRPGAKGVVMGWVRGAAYPFIFAHNNYQYNMQL